jgi:hypothetical protein
VLTARLTPLGPGVRRDDEGFGTCRMAAASYRLQLCCHSTRLAKTARSDIRIMQ